jgi:hypothetical protein
MKTPKDFDASRYIEEMSSISPLVEQYFCNEQLDIMDSIDELYSKLDVLSEIVPLSTIELLEKG